MGGWVALVQHWYALSAITSPMGSNCSSQLGQICGAARSASVGNCLVCAGEHQPQLHRASCTSTEVEAWCDGPAPPSPLRYQRTVLHLSAARRDVAMAGYSRGAAGAVVAGGCMDSSQRPYAQFSCSSPSNRIDLVTRRANGSFAIREIAQGLSSARAWSTACTSGSTVLIAGGGTSANKSRAADLIDIHSLEISTATDALPTGRWGMACAADDDGAFFGGGIQMGHGGYTTEIIYYDGTSSWRRLTLELSESKESAGATLIATTGDSKVKKLAFSGGWNENTDGQLDSVDCYTVKTSVFSAARSSCGTQGQARLSSAVYWPGAVTVGSSSYIVDNTDLNVLNNSGLHRESLPSYLRSEHSASNPEGGGAIPGAHMAQNGVAVGRLACFYSFTAGPPIRSAVDCFDTLQWRWAQGMNCSAAHKAGGIAAFENAIVVAGGYAPGPNNVGVATTNVVDIFELT
eukprot:COSAG05_NODE_330_length_11274_cov_4.167696_4_plen_461_part_00